jgi:ATP-dependent Lon protease
LPLSPEDLQKRLDTLDLPQEATATARARVASIQGTESTSLEYVDTHYYLDHLLRLPWGDAPATKVDPLTLAGQLRMGHYTPEFVQEALVEFLASAYSQPTNGGLARLPVPVLAGPEGTGKRTLGRKIGAAIGRPVEVVDLRLMANDAGLFGAMSERGRGQPGAIVNALQQADRRDAVVVLANLEWAIRTWEDHGLSVINLVFNASERARFRDRFLDVEFDLGSVLFVITTNALDFLPPEVYSKVLPVECTGYVAARKLELLEEQLLPALLAKHGLAADDFDLQEDAATVLVKEYAHEAGVAILEAVLDEACRKVAAGKLLKKPPPERIDPEVVRELLGVPRKYLGTLDQLGQPGMAKGILGSIEGASVEMLEVATVPGSRGFTVAGQQMDEMGRVIDVAYNFVRSRMTELDISARQLYEYGYTFNHRIAGDNRDAPAMSLAVLVALVSALRDKLVDPELALTGDMALGGKVLGVGGLDHKLLAAHRHGIRRMIIPRANEPDLDDLPDSLASEMSIVTVGDVEQALRIALQ